MGKLYILFISICFVSCQSVYLAGYSGSEYHHLETPFAQADTTITAHYLKGGIQEGVEFYKNEKNDIQYLGYHYAISRDYIGFAIGANAFHAKYKVSSFIGNKEFLNQSYDYWGGEFLAKFNINIPISNVFHWRIIGAQMSWNFERGDFYDFRDDLIKLDDEMEDGTSFMDNATNISFYADTEFMFNPAKDLYMGFNSAFGFGIKYMNFNFVTGTNIEYKRVGLKCSYREGTPSLLYASISTFDNTVNNDVHSWEYGVYYRF
jgi:hypothetical protein